MKNAETLILQDVWRQAFRKGELTLTFKTQAGAQRARMQLYNSVKLQKAGKDMSDIELVHAAENMEIVWASEDKTQFRLQRRDKSDMMQGIMAALEGKTMEQYVDPEAQESAERLLKQLNNEETAQTKPVPFYGRRGE